MWRCCTHSNTELHLYDCPHQGEWEIRHTLVGSLRLPKHARGFVPFATVSGNMFGEPTVLRAVDVVAAAPATLTRHWLVQVNGNDNTICIDRALVLVSAVQGRYGRGACVQAIKAMLPASQQPVFEAMAACFSTPRSCARRCYVRYVQCIKDLLDRTATSRPVTLCYGTQTRAVSPLTSWKQLVRAVPPEWTCSLRHPLTLTARAALARENFLLEELRADTIELVFEPTRKRKR
jgi:hypothetical protein